MIVKHANPCGVAEQSSQLEAYQTAFETDPESAFGGIIAFNDTLQCATAESILEKQFVEVIIAPAMEDGVREVAWDGRSVGDWASEVDGADAVMNLAGRNIDCRPNKKNREELLRSRVDSTRAIGEAVQAAQNPPAVWVNASAMAYYGDVGAADGHGCSLGTSWTAVVRRGSRNGWDTVLCCLVLRADGFVVCSGDRCCAD